MKRSKVLAVIALIALTGFLWMGCDSDSGTGGGGGSTGGGGVTDKGDGQAANLPDTGSTMTITFDRESLFFSGGALGGVDLVFTTSVPVPVGWNANLSITPLTNIYTPNLNVAPTDWSFNNSGTGTLHSVRVTITGTDTVVRTYSLTLTLIGGGKTVTKSIPMVVAPALINPVVTLSKAVTAPAGGYYTTDDITTIWKGINVVVTATNLPAAGISIPLGASDLNVTYSNWGVGDTPFKAANADLTIPETIVRYNGIGSIGAANRIPAMKIQDDTVENFEVVGSLKKTSYYQYIDSMNGPLNATLGTSLPAGTSLSLELASNSFEGLSFKATYKNPRLVTTLPQTLAAIGAPASLMTATRTVSKTVVTIPRWNLNWGPTGFGVFDFAVDALSTVGSIPGNLNTIPTPGALVLYFKYVDLLAAVHGTTVTATTQSTPTPPPALARASSQQVTVTLYQAALNKFKLGGYAPIPAGGTIPSMLDFPLRATNSEQNVLEAYLDAYPLTATVAYTSDGTNYTDEDVTKFIPTKMTGTMATPAVSSYYSISGRSGSNDIVHSSGPGNLPDAGYIEYTITNLTGGFGTNTVTGTNPEDTKFRVYDPTTAP